MKSYQVFKIYKRFDKEKHKEKLRKVGFAL